MCCIKYFGYTLREALTDSTIGEVCVEAIPIYVEELLLLLTCYVEGTS